MHDPLDLRDLLADEMAQRRESGFLVEGLAGAIEMALREATGPVDEGLASLLEALEASEPDPAWPYEEPDDLAAIVASLPAQAPAAPVGPDLGSRLLGAWLGRCAGCTLGKPVEGLPRARLLEFLAQAHADPRRGYLPGTPALAAAYGLKPAWPVSTRGSIHGAPRDDDLDYTVLALLLLERHGRDFDAVDVTGNLLLELPYLRVYTAERVTYRNLIHGLQPPATARWRNPYREWIGALIRADLYGYVCPGRPRAALELAYRDACTSHTANGILAALWTAALLAEALVRTDAVDALDASLAHVPPRSRLAEALGRTLELHAARSTWEEAQERLAAWYGEYSWVHAIPNAAAIAAGLLWGEGDFGATVGLTVLAGLDTDSSAATAGSVFGALHGPAAIPASWTGPLEDRLESAIPGFGSTPISALAERTFVLATGGDR